MEIAKDQLQQCFRDAFWLQARGQLTPENVLEYFYVSPFYDPRSLNQSVRAGALTIAAMDLAPGERFALRRCTVVITAGASTSNIPSEVWRREWRRIVMETLPSENPSITMENQAHTSLKSRALPNLCRGCNKAVDVLRKYSVLMAVEFPSLLSAS